LGGSERQQAQFVRYGRPGAALVSLVVFGIYDLVAPSRHVPLAARPPPPWRSSSREWESRHGRRRRSEVVVEETGLETWERRGVSRSDDLFAAGWPVRELCRELSA
jgi:hypothetical protein